MTATVQEPVRVRLFGSIEYSWLFVAQVISAFGDWVGFFAVTALAAAIWNNAAAATALVLTARVAPSFFLGPFMGVLVDRYDRKVLMRIADLARALIFCVLPWVTTVQGLIVASLLLEVFTLMWSPAKEALVPLLVPRDRLTNANSQGLLAAYGTMPFAALTAALFAAADDRLAGFDWLQPLGFGRDIGTTHTLVFYFDALTFLVTAFIVWRFIKVDATPRHASSVASAAVANGAVANGAVDETPSGLRAMVGEVRDGWRFIWSNPVVRAVNVGLAAGLLGGAMLVPLGPTFAKDIIGDVDKFPLYITALGCGVAAGVALLTAFQSRIPKEKGFCASLFFAGLSILFGVSMSTFWLSAIGVLGLGLGAGSAYVLGYTLLQENTADELRGRTFTTFLTSVRLCVLGALLLGPTMAALLDPLLRRWTGSDPPVVHWFGVDYLLPGVRVALWVGGLLILVAATLASRSIDPSSGRIHLPHRSKAAP